VQIAVGYRRLQELGERDRFVDPVADFERVRPLHRPAQLRIAIGRGLGQTSDVVVDGDEQTVRPSLIWAQGELPDRAYARVLHENVATQSSIMIRASLRDRVAPIPAAITDADWWITLRSAQFSAIDYSREPLAFYRVHGSNLTGDVTGAAAVREARKSVAFQLWALRNLPLSLLDPEEMVFVWNGIEAQAQRMVQAAGTFFVEPADPAPDLAAGVDGLLADADRLAQRGDYAGEAEQDGRQILADLVVQLPGDPQPLGLLAGQDPAGCLAPFGLQTGEHLVEGQRQLAGFRGRLGVGNPLAGTQQVDAPGQSGERFQRAYDSPQDHQVDERHESQRGE